MKLPKLKLPNLKLPSGNNPQGELLKMIKNRGTNTSSILNDAKSKVPEPIKKYVPNFDAANDIDVSKIMGQSAFDVEGIMSKSFNMSDINKMLSMDIDI